MSAVVMKIPVPTTEPMVKSVASQRPRPRTSLSGISGPCDSELDESVTSTSR
jgi:hypothetical protein